MPAVGSLPYVIKRVPLLRLTEVQGGRFAALSLSLKIFLLEFEKSFLFSGGGNLTSSLGCVGTPNAFPLQGAGSGSEVSNRLLPDAPQCRGPRNLCERQSRFRYVPARRSWHSGAESKMHFLPRVSPGSVQQCRPTWVILTSNLE